MKELESYRRCPWKIKVGEITESAFREYLEITKEHFPRPLWIDLDSDGGNLEVAFDWGDVIRQYGKYGEVVVSGNRIRSSAVILFLSAPARLVSESSFIQFHYPVMKGQHSDSNRERHKILLEKLQKFIPRYSLITDKEIRTYLRDEICLLGEEILRKVPGTESC